MARSDQWRLHEPLHVVALCEPQSLKHRPQLVRPEWQYQPSAGLWRPATDLQRQLGRPLETSASFGRPDASIAACPVTVTRHVAIANPNAGWYSLWRIQFSATAAAVLPSSTHSLSTFAAEPVSVVECYSVTDHATSAVPSAATATTTHVDSFTCYLRTDHVSCAVDRFQQHDAARRLHSAAVIWRQLQSFFITSYEHVSRHHFCATDAAAVSAEALPTTPATTATTSASQQYGSSAR